MHISISTIAYFWSEGAMIGQAVRPDLSHPSELGNAAHCKQESLAGGEEEGGARDCIKRRQQ